MTGRACRAPAGYWPIDVRWPHVTVAGSMLYCCNCGAEGRAPLPRDVAEYNAAVAVWLEQHRGCCR